MSIIETLWRQFEHSDGFAAIAWLCFFVAFVILAILWACLPLLLLRTNAKLDRLINIQERAAARPSVPVGPPVEIV